MPSYLTTHNNSECCGCGACVSICPKKCISFQADKSGFFYPNIDSTKCIKCNLCQSVCVYNKQKDFNKVNKDFFAGHNTNIEQMKISSSGGVLPLLCESIIEKGGVVFSVTRDATNFVKYIKIETRDEIPSIQGSKYVQADTKDIFASIREQLNNGKLVLFSGTPCHVAALQAFLKKSYENLFTVSVICHGVPSQKMFLDYIKYLEKKHKGKLVDINFRDKEKNGWSITLSYVISRKRKNKKYYVSSKLSPYFIGFLKGLIIRESCHNCLFAGLNHESDIMLGDFWGYQEKYSSYKSDYGFSIFSINSNKGRNLFSLINQSLLYVDVDSNDVLNSLNTNLKRSTLRNEKYHSLIKDYETFGFDYIVSNYLKPDHPIKETIKAFMPRFLLVYLTKKRRKK